MSRFIAPISESDANGMTPMRIAAVIVAITLASGSLDLSQVGFAFIGVCFYLVFWSQSETNVPKHVQRKEGRSKRSRSERRAGGAQAASFQLRECVQPKPNIRLSTYRNSEAAQRGRRASGAQAELSQSDSARLASAATSNAIGVDRKTVSARPVLAPTFTAVGFDQEVEELTVRLLPSAEGDESLRRIVARIKDVVLRTLPEAEVVGLSCSDPWRGGAFAVAVPEVEIVITMNPEILAERLRPSVRYGLKPEAGEGWKLNKQALRSIASQLGSKGGFQFRRATFRTHEPKVTLLSPQAPGDREEAIALDLSVNSIVPLWHAALLAECARIEPRSRALILLVRRWAKHRAICQMAKGHLEPAAWSVLAIYFLQVGVESEGALLPSLEEFEMASQIMRADSQASDNFPEPPRARWVRARTDGPKKSVADLFREFFVFYHTVFDWRGEAVSIRTAKRVAPGPRLPLNVFCDASGKRELSLCIEDPFDSGRNFGSNFNSSSFSRLNQEIARASAMCGAGESLTELLVPWAPPAGTEAEEEQMMTQADRNDAQLLVQETPQQANRAHGGQLNGGLLAWLGNLDDEDDFEYHHAASSRSGPTPTPMPAHETAMLHLYPGSSDSNWEIPGHCLRESPAGISGFQYQ